MDEPKDIDSSGILGNALKDPLSGDSLAMASVYLNNVMFLTTLLQAMRYSQSHEARNMKSKRKANIRALKALVLEFDKVTDDD